MNINENLNPDSTEKEDFDSLRGLITLGGDPKELIIPYLEGINLQKNRLENLRNYIQGQKQDKKNQFLLDLIEKFS
jgi:ribosomal protein S15P/S13E